jgi:hypothetical protein
LARKEGLFQLAQSLLLEVVDQKSNPCKIEQIKLWWACGEKHRALKALSSLFDDPETNSETSLPNNNYPKSPNGSPTEISPRVKVF